MISTDAIWVVVGVPPLDLQVFRLVRSYRIREGARLPYNNLVNSNKVEGLGPYAFKRLLDKNVRIKHNANIVGFAMYEYLKCVPVKGIFIVNFGFKVAFLLTALEWVAFNIQAAMAR